MPKAVAHRTHHQSTSPPRKVPEPRVRALALILFLSCGSTPACHSSVLRIQDGATLSGKPISQEAYAAFMRGRLLELAGNASEAAKVYETVLALDSNAAEAHVRLGALKCQVDAAAAAAAFEHAEALEADLASLWQEKSRCALAQRRAADALSAARKAMILAPTDRTSTDLLMAALALDGRPQEARSLAWASVAMLPNSPRAWHNLYDFEEPKQRTALALETGRRFGGPRSTTRTSDSAGSQSEATEYGRSADATARVPVDPRELIEALHQGSEDDIARAARRLRLTALKLAIAAFSVGAYEVSKREALRAFRASPDNIDAWALSIVSAELLGDQVALTEVLAHTIPTRGHMCPEVTLAWNAMLARQ